jgi:hypothetical protein
MRVRSFLKRRYEAVFARLRSWLLEIARVLVRRTSGDTRHKIQGAFARRIRTVSPREAERCGGLRQ